MLTAQRHLQIKAIEQWAADATPILLTAVLTVASVVGVAHGSAATESVAVASLGSMKETAPVCGASNHASTVAPPPPG